MKKKLSRIKKLKRNLENKKEVKKVKPYDMSKFEELKK